MQANKESRDQPNTADKDEEESSTLSIGTEDEDNEQEGLLSSWASSKHDEVVSEAQKMGRTSSPLGAYFEGSDEKRLSMRNFASKMALLVLFLVAALLVTALSGMHQRERVSEHEDAEFLDSEANVPTDGADDKGKGNNSRSEDLNNTVKYYSLAKTDRAGAQILDMLMMDSFLYYQGGVFGGACPEFRTQKQQESFDAHLASKLELIHLLGFEDVFLLDCPTQEDLDSGKAKFLKQAEYHHFSETFTMEWVHHLRAKSKVQYTERKPDDPLKVAVHMRRGDYSPCRDGHGQKYLPNQYYLDVLDEYLPRYCPDRKDCNLTIYSEKRAFENFKAFEERSYHIDFDSSLEQIWTDFMSADLLILSKSSFSWVPAIMNQHHVITPKYKYPVCDNWDVASQGIVARSDKINDDYKQSCPRKHGLRRWLF